MTDDIFVILKLIPDSTASRQPEFFERSVARAVAEIATRYGVTFQTLHPSARNANLARCVFAHVGSHTVAAELVKDLSAIDSIEAVYIRPPDDSPN